MPRFQDNTHITVLTGAEIIPCIQFGQPEDGWVLSTDIVNLPETAATVAGTSYTFVDGDQNIIREFTSTSSVVCGVPADTTMNFAVGTVLRWVQIGTGRIFFGSAPGTTIRWPQDNTGANCMIARKINSSGLFRKRAANDWHAVGDLSAT